MRKPWSAVILFTCLVTGSSVPALARTDDAGSAARATAGMATVAQNLARREDGYGACSGFKSLRAYPALANLDEIVRHRWPSPACRPKQQSWIQSASATAERIRKRRGPQWGPRLCHPIAGSNSGPNPLAFRAFPHDWALYHSARKSAWRHSLPPGSPACLAGSTAR